MPIIRQYEETADRTKELTQRLIKPGYDVLISQRTGKPYCLAKLKPATTGTNPPPLYAAPVAKTVIYEVGHTYAVVPKRGEPSVWMHQGEEPTHSGQRFGVGQRVILKDSNRFGEVVGYNPHREADHGYVSDKDYSVRLLRDGGESYEPVALWFSAEELTSVLLLPLPGAEGRRDTEHWAARGFRQMRILITAIEKGLLQDMTDEQVLREGVASRAAYIELWEAINGAGAWALNPEVARISYKLWYPAKKVAEQPALAIPPGNRERRIS